MDDYRDILEETIEKQSNLLRQQQAFLQALQTELLECQANSSALNGKNQMKIESILNLYKDSLETEYIEEIKLLKKQVEDALKEKELLASENSKLLQELQLIRHGQLGQSRKEDERRPQNAHAEYTEVIQILENETERLRKELIDIEEEKVQILKRDYNDKTKLSALEENIKENEEQISFLRAALDESQQQTTNLQNQLTPQKNEICRLQELSANIFKEKDSLQKILSSVKIKLVEGEKKVAQTLRVAEEAILEKDAALLREKHALDEISRLENSTQELVKESGQKTRQEICKVKDNYNCKIKKISEEFVQVEMDLNGRNLEVERCLIEKKKMEKELDNLAKEIEKMKQAKKEESGRMMQRMTDLERKNIQLSISKDSLMQKFNKLSTDSKIDIEEAAKRVSELEASLESSDREVVKCKSTLEKLNLENDSLNGKILKEKELFTKREKFLLSQLKKTCQELENVKSSFNRRLENSKRLQTSLITQLFSNLEVLQKQVESLQSLHKSQIREFDMKFINLKVKCDDLTTRNEKLFQTLQGSESKLLIQIESNKEYKERLKATDKELEEMKNRYSSLVRSARDQS